MEFSIVPNPTSRGNLRKDVPRWVGEVAVVGPSRGGYPEAEQLLYFHLLH